MVQLNRDTLYEIMVRNSWYLPRIKCSAVTVDYMLAVREGQIFCPKFEDIRLKPCPKPPSKDELMGYIRRLEAWKGI